MKGLGAGPAMGFFKVSAKSENGYAKRGLLLKSYGLKALDGLFNREEPLHEKETTMFPQEGESSAVGKRREFTEMVK